MTQDEKPLVPLTPRQRRIAYPSAAAIAATVLGGVAASNLTGSIAYALVAGGLAIGGWSLLSAWIARSHHLTFWSIFLLQPQAQTRGRLLEALQPSPFVLRCGGAGAVAVATYSMLVTAAGQEIPTRAWYLGAGLVSGALFGVMMGVEYKDGGKWSRRMIRLFAALMLGMTAYAVITELLG